MIKTTKPSLRRTHPGSVLLNAEARWRTMKAYRPHLEDEEIGVFETIIERHQPVTDHPAACRPQVRLEGPQGD